MIDRDTVLQRLEIVQQYLDKTVAETIHAFRIKNSHTNGDDSGSDLASAQLADLLAAKRDVPLHECMHYVYDEAFLHCVALIDCDMEPFNIFWVLYGLYAYGETPRTAT